MKKASNSPTLVQSQIRGAIPIWKARQNHEKCQRVGAQKQREALTSIGIKNKSQP